MLLCRVPVKGFWKHAVVSKHLTRCSLFAVDHIEGGSEVSAHHPEAGDGGEAERLQRRARHHHAREQLPDVLERAAGNTHRQHLRTVAIPSSDRPRGFEGL